MVTEFEFIRDLKSKYGLARVGDDCAVLPKDADTDLLLTTDMLVEDIDFRLEWTTPEFLGHKALAISLSDIAAMGGTPNWAMLSISVAETAWHSVFLERFYDGWFALAEEYKVELVGGDISRSSDKLVIDSMVGGEVAKDGPILRSTANPGDAIYVTGSLGGAAGALKMLEKGIRFDQKLPHNMKELLLRQLRPTPQVTTGNSLQILHIATAMIDLSDGLSSDLAHLCEDSMVGARIYADKLPVDPLICSHFPFDAGLAMAMNGGEDFELLFTVEPRSIVKSQIAGVTYIGEITKHAGNIELIQDGMTKPLRPRGYRHF